MNGAEHDRQPPQHLKARNALRLVGGILLLVGLGLFVSGLVDFFEPGGPTRFWMAMVGLPVLGVGLMVSQMGWLGAFAKYAVRERSPAVIEGVNRVGAGAAPGITAVAAAVATGMREGPRIACGSCGDLQASDAKFCDACGKAMRVVCPSCGAAGEAGARFCDRCGMSMA